MSKSRWWERWRHPWLLTLLGVSLACVLYGAGLTLNSLTEIGKPFPGFMFEQCLDVSTLRPTGWTGSERGLVNYDLLLSANGKPLTTPADLMGLVRAVPVGTPIRYEIERQGHRLIRVVPTQRFGVAEFNQSALLWVVSGFLMMLIGIVAFVLKPENAAARAHLLVTLASGTTLLEFTDEYLAHHLAQIPLASFYLFGGALIHLAAVFPTVPGWLCRRPWLLAVPHLVSGALGVWVLTNCRAVGAAVDPTGVARFFLQSQVYAVWLLTGLLALMGRTLVATFRGATPLARNQARLVLFGTVIGFMPNILGWILPEITGHVKVIQSWQMTLEYIGFLLFPLVIAYAILRHRLFDISWAARRAVLYGSLVGPLGGGYGLLSVFGAQYLNQERPTAFAVLSAVLVGIVARPVHDVLKRGLDRLFLGERAEGMRLLAGFAVPDEGDVPAIAARLRDLVQRSIGTRWVSLRYQDQVWGEEAAEEDSEVVELSLGGQGCLRVGPKLNGLALNQEELHLLKVASSQVAIALENRRLSEERERLHIQEAVSRALASQRAQILSEVLHDLGNDLLRIQVEADMLGSELGADARVAAIGQSMDRIGRLLDEKSRLLTGKQAERSVSMLPDALASVLVTLEPQLSVRRQQVVVEGAIDEAQVGLSAVELDQVLGNVVGNASKFSGDGTVIRVVCREAAGCWWVRVADEGPGIPVSLLGQLGSGARGDELVPGKGLGLRNVLAVLGRAGGELSWGNHAAGAWVEVRLPAGGEAEGDRQGTSS